MQVSRPSVVPPWLESVSGNHLASQLHRRAFDNVWTVEMVMCFVFGCGHRTDKRSEVGCSLFRFPIDERVRKKWVNLCRLVYLLKSWKNELSKSLRPMSTSSPWPIDLFKTSRPSYLVLYLSVDIIAIEERSSIPVVSVFLYCQVHFEVLVVIGLQC